MLIFGQIGQKLAKVKNKLWVILISVLACANADLHSTAWINAAKDNLTLTNPTSSECLSSQFGVKKKKANNSPKERRWYWKAAKLLQTSQTSRLAPFPSPGHDSSSGALPQQATPAQILPPKLAPALWAAFPSEGANLRRTVHASDKTTQGNFVGLKDTARIFRGFFFFFCA